MRHKKTVPSSCRKSGFECLEDAIRTTLEIGPHEPLANRRAEFLQLLGLAQRAIKSGSWTVKNYVTKPRHEKIHCVHVGDFREWGERQRPDAQMIEFESNKLRASAIETLLVSDKETTSGVDLISRVLELVEDKWGADIELGKQTHKQRSDFANIHAKELHDKREPEWKKWRHEAARLKNRHPHLARSRMKTKLARLVKKNLRLTESVQTISKRI